MEKAHLNLAKKGILLLGVFAAVSFSHDSRGEQARCMVASPGTWMDVVAECGMYKYRVKSGNCKTDCQVSETITPYNVDLTNVGATTGKRMWTAAAQHMYTFGIDHTNNNILNCNDTRKQQNANKCDAYFNTIRGRASEDMKAYCPDPLKSEFQKQGLAVNPTTMCRQYDPYDNCSRFSPDNSRDTFCPNPTDLNSSDPDCPNFDGFEDSDWQQYNQCMRNYEVQYDRCMTNVFNNPDNMNAGVDDCYCKSEDEYFKFDTSIGAWKCVPCEGAGFKQDKTSGTSCKPPCSASQVWNPATNLCESSSACTQDPLKEIHAGQCVLRCNGNQERNAQGQCANVCPTGMTVQTIGGVKQCGCNDVRFGVGHSRVPVRSSAVAGLRYPAWVSGGIVPLSPTPDNTMSCACASAPGATSVSMLDFAEAVTDTDFRTLPYGPVGIVAGTSPGAGGALFNNYTCGCPNLNERFIQDPSDNRWKCLSAITDQTGGRAGPGLTLATIPSDADLALSTVRTQQKIIDGISSMPARPMAMLRSQASGQDLSISYRRKVWRCADGFFLNSNNRCMPIESDPAQLAMQNCSDATPVRSSSYLEGATAANFNRLTNRRLACCMGQKADVTDPTKFHCLSTDPGAYTNFDDYYDAGAAGGVDFVGLRAPNRLYLRDGNNHPIPGVYSKSGTRCTTLDALTPTRQLAALNAVRTNIRANEKLNPFRGIAGVTANTFEQNECRFVVRTALEVVCPPEGADPVTGAARTIAYNRTDPTYLSSDNRVRRCFQPEALRVHYAIEDLTTPGNTKRAVIRSVSSIGPDGEPASSVDIQRLIRSP